MNLSPAIPRNRRFLAEWLVLLCALLALGTYVGYLQYGEYRQIELQEHERLNTQAAVVERNVTPQLLLAGHLIDEIIADLPTWRKGQDGIAAANHQLHLINDAMIGIQPIMVIEPDGKVRASSNPVLEGMNFAHREYFRTAQAKADPAALHVSAPFKTVLNDYVISLARTIPGPNGAFGGIVVVGISPEHFSTLLDSVRYAPDMRTSIAHGDGQLFVTAPATRDIESKNLATPGSFFTRHRDSGRPANLFTGTVFVSGDERMMALRSIRVASMDKALVVAVSRPLEAVFAQWKKDLQMQGALLGVIAVLSTLGLFVVQRRQRVRYIERRQAEGRIRELLDEQRLIFDNANVGIVMLRRRQIVKCNQHLAEIFGYAGPAEIEGKTTEIFFCSAEDFKAVGDHMYASMAAQGSVQFEVEMRRRDGRHIWIMMTGRPLDPTAVRDGSIWVYTDITDRKQADAEQRIAATAFESQEGMIITDADGVILRANRAFTRITGYTADEVVGQKPNLLKSGRHDDDFYRAMWTCIHQTGAWQGEIWDRRKNGEIYPKWLTISAVKGDNGEVTHYIGAQFDISERKSAEEKINELAYFDQLTGLPNRTLLLDRLQQVMTTSVRSGSYGALLFIDLDNFKTLNDTLGHEAGDLLLKLASQRLKTCLREGDTAARLGGDEFVVMLAGLGQNENDAAMAIEAVAEKILAALGQAYQLDSVAFHSTASVGITLFRGQAASIDDLMKQADLAMYKAKEAGRNAFRFFDPDMELAVQARAALESDLRRALEEKQFLLHYQAQVVDSGRVTGAEVLVRWLHPQRGMVSPANFIPFAEETGLILPLGLWVLETACEQLAHWASQAEMAQLTIAVNVSAQQFRQADFVDQVLAVLTRTGADPRRLKLELTESLLVENVQDIIQKMSALKAQGVGFALDDFGTGYSSLSYLKRLPLDQLKIDQSFVRDVLTDPNDAAIARTVIALAQSLGLGVIAEGVETDAQWRFLTSSGCHAYQGYFFSRPLPVADFEEYARKSCLVA